MWSIYNSSDEITHFIGFVLELSVLYPIVILTVVIFFLICFRSLRFDGYLYF